MTTQLPSEEKFPDSLCGLRNSKNQLASELEALLKPFCKRYQLRPDQVEVLFNHAGVLVKVTF